jgi:hypothetical protein
MELAFHGSILGSVHIWEQWSSYNRTWFSGPDKQEISIFILWD